MTVEYRLEKDTLGEAHVPADKYWGPQTQRSLAYFHIGIEKMPPVFMRAFALQKKTAALTNMQLDVLPADIGNAIVQAADEVINGKWDAHFPLPIWQAGSGTQTHINLNEVIAHRAQELLPPGVSSIIHPNEHVNCSQSTNDSFPTAIHIAIALETHTCLLPSLNVLEIALRDKSNEYTDIIKVGRTHLQDAALITLGQEFSAYAEQVRLGIQRIENALRNIYTLPQGGTEVGTGLNAPKGFDEVFCKVLTDLTEQPFISTYNKFEAIATRDACVEFSGALNVLAVSFMKIANDIKLLASGPRCGIGELSLPLNEPGSSIMSCNANPSQAEALSMVAAQVMGNHTAITIGASHGHLELNTFMPMIMYNVLQSIRLLGDAGKSFTKHCVVDIKVDKEKIDFYRENCLVLATALNRHIGYDLAIHAAQTAYEEGISLKEAVLQLGITTEKEFDIWTNPHKLIKTFEP